MASSAYVNNVVPIKLWLDNGAKARQKAFENACKVDEILHDREMKVNLVWFKLNLLLSYIFILSSSPSRPVLFGPLPVPYPSLTHLPSLGLIKGWGQTLLSSSWTWTWP